jgi:hypothetical protein
LSRIREYIPASWSGHLAVSSRRVAPLLRT